jgi:hypothetical protein
MQRSAHATRVATRRWPYNGLRPVPTQARPAPRPPRRMGALLALAFFAFYALTSTGTLNSRDGGVMYDTAMAIVNRHSLALPPHHHGLPGVGGGFYSKYGIAQSIVEIPLYVLGQHLATWAQPPLARVLALAVTMLTNPLLTALALWLFFLLAEEIAPCRRGATLATVLLGVASPYWPYAKTDFSEPLSALAFTGAILYLVRARARPTAGNFATSGAFMALALLTKLTAALALPAAGLYVLYLTAGRGRPAARVPWLLAWGLPVIAGLALDALYDTARYGHLADTGYHAEDLPFHAPLGRGLEGLLVSPGKGLLWYCPLVVVALALWPLLLRRRRAEGLLALGVVLPALVVVATYPIWWGGICWGPRYLVPLLPLALLPLAYVHEWLPRATAAARAITAIVALSVAVQIPGVAVHPARFLNTGIRDAAYLWRPADSPVLGQAWLAAYDAVGAVDRRAADALLAGYPWRRPGGTSPTQRLAIGHWSYWWWEILGSRGLSRAAQAILAAALALALALAAWRLRELYRAAGRRPYDHEHMARLMASH